MGASPPRPGPPPAVARRLFFLSPREARAGRESERGASHKRIPPLPNPAQQPASGKRVEWPLSRPAGTLSPFLRGERGRSGYRAPSAHIVRGNLSSRPRQKAREQGPKTCLVAGNKELTMSGEVSPRSVAFPLDALAVAEWTSIHEPESFSNQPSSFSPNQRCHHCRHRRAGMVHGTRRSPCRRAQATGSE